MMKIVSDWLKNRIMQDTLFEIYFCICNFFWGGGGGGVFTKEKKVHEYSQ